MDRLHIQNRITELEAELLQLRGGAQAPLPDGHSFPGQLFQLLDSLPVMVLVPNDQTRRTFLNTEFTAITGWTNEDVEGFDILELCYPDPYYRRLFGEFLASPEQAWKEFRIASRSGISIDSSWAQRFLPGGQKVLVGIDIRSRIKSDEERERLLGAIENEREKLKTIMDSIADEVWFTDTTGNSVTLNPAVHTWLGVNGTDHDRGLEDLLSSLEILNPDGSPRPVGEAPILLSLKGEIRSGDEIVRHLKTGKLRYRHYHSAPVRNREHRIIGAVMVISDITASKRLEQELQRHAEELAGANKELESFTYSVSHDLRNFLNNIVAMTAVLKEFYETALDDDGKRCIKEINGSAAKMAGVIESLLRLSRISQQELKISPVSLSDIASSVIEELQKASRRERTEVVIEQGMAAQADPELIYVALANLIGNAWKYTCKLPNARIEFGRTRKDHLEVFYVRDNGVGFDMKDADKLFTPFHRFHNESDFPGIGLGLPVVERIIRRHGGSIWAQSERGKGSTFFFTLAMESKSGDHYAHQAEPGGDRHHPAQSG